MARYGSPFVSAYTMQEVQIRNSSKILKNTGNTKYGICTCEWQGMVIPPSGHMICTAPIRITALSSPIMGYSNLPSYT